MTATDIETQITEAPEAGPAEVAIDKATAAAAPITAAQARVDAVGTVLFKAYEKASTLAFTKEESDALMAEFPDEAFQTGAAGKESLIYIGHAHLRERFIKVLGLGQWAIITRRSWAEPFKTATGKDGVKIYVEAVLLIRGCMAGEAIGDMDYFTNNASQNYGDAVEGAKTAAFRRCAKELGVGLQAWKKEFCEGWFNRKLEREEQAREARRVADRGLPTTTVTSALQPNTGILRGETTPETPRGAPIPAAFPVPSAEIPSDSWVNKLLEVSKAKILKEFEPIIDTATAYAMEAGLILPTETVADTRASSLFPGIKPGMVKDEILTLITAGYNAHMREILKRINKGDGDDQIPGAEVSKAWPTDLIPSAAAPKKRERPVSDDATRRVVDVKHVTSKQAMNAKGSYTRYGLVDSSETWYNTFDKTIGEKAIALKGRRALIHFTTDKYGNKLEGIEPAPEE